MIELKPCPFCGGKAKLINTGFPPYWVHCETCGAKVNGKTNNKLDSINVWNHRMDEVIMRCKDCKHYNYDTTYDKSWCTRGYKYVLTVRQDDFCSFGKRREGDTE